MVNERIASYMPGGDTTQAILDTVNNEIYSDPRMRELLAMQAIAMRELSVQHSQGVVRLALEIRREKKANDNMDSV
jgi:hypothetical protein